MDDNKFTIELLLDILHDTTNIKSQIVTYTTADKVKTFSNSIVIFCDLERFTADDIGNATELFDRVTNDGPKRVLNNPSKVLTRYKLLRRLYEEGINSFNVHHLPIGESKLSYPLFIRNELDHQGPLSQLLYSDEDMSKYIASMEYKKKGPFIPLVTEFYDISNNEKEYHKYGAFYFCDVVLPRHLFFSSHWMVKGSENQTKQHLDMEMDYLNNNDFKQEIAKVFQIANIDYGRIDFAIFNNSLQVFEINTNPTIIDKGDLISNRKAVTDFFISTFSSVLRTHDS